MRGRAALGLTATVGIESGSSEMAGELVIGRRSKGLGTFGGVKDRFFCRIAAKSFVLAACSTGGP
jgi:hypothetical protein